jgi:molecular chaperone DnaJ
VQKRDYYEVLGVDRGASLQEIKKAYRGIARQFHPDRNPGNAEAETTFKEASEAYAVLADDEKRAAYDRFGHAGIGGGTGNPFGEGFDPFQSFGDLFEEFFGRDVFGRRGSRGGGRRGADLRYDLEVDFRVAANGGEETLRIPRHETCVTCQGQGGERETCPRCNGQGQIQLQQGFFRIARACDRCGGLGQSLKRACPDCRGQGRIESMHKLSVRIPAGVDTGTRLRLRGEGEAGVQGGPAGDLFVVVTVREHPMFQRDGADLICELPISIAQATLGAELEVPAIEGKRTVRIEPGTQPGHVIRLRGAGLPRLGGAGRGDQLVQVYVEIPNKLNARQRELMEKFAEVSGDDVTPRRSSFLDKLKELF